MNGRIGIQYLEQLTSAFSIRLPSHRPRCALLNRHEVVGIQSIRLVPRYSSKPMIVLTGCIQWGIALGSTYGDQQTGGVNERSTSERLTVASRILSEFKKVRTPWTHLPQRHLLEHRRRWRCSPTSIWPHRQESQCSWLYITRDKAVGLAAEMAENSYVKVLINGKAHTSDDLQWKRGPTSLNEPFVSFFV